MDDKKKIDLGMLAAEAGKNASALWGKAKKTFVQATDQNDDGSFDMKDVSAIAEAIGAAAKTTAAAVKSNAEERSRELERRMLQPIFVEDLDNADFLLSKLIRVADIDKKHALSDVCKGSIGFISEQKDLKIIHIFRDKVDHFGLTFYPDADCELYYVDPSDRDRYIALDEYFGYLKVERINELQKIAQDLGAKHFRVTYKEQKSTFSGSTVKIKANAVRATGDAEHNLSTSALSAVEVAAEMECPGHAPTQPHLRYLQRESSIQTLITLRMDKNSPLTHQKFTLNLSNSSGIKEKDAIKIDAALKAMKISGNTTVANEVRNESRRFFEYEIDF
ncbi:MAG: hypothetical protein IKU70_11325 [Clostridia bacterium]|nr:hypothetical protein [Clostridia bacterium]